MPDNGYILFDAGLFIGALLKGDPSFIVTISPPIVKSMKIFLLIGDVGSFAIFWIYEDF